MEISADKLKKEITVLKKENARLTQANHKLNEQVLELYTLYNVSRSLSLFMQIDQLFDTTMTVIGNSLNLDEFCLMLVDEESGKLIMRACHGLDTKIIENLNVAIGQGVSGKVAQTGEAVLIQDISKVKEFFYYPGSNITYGSFLGVPLKNRERKVIGVLNAHKPEPGQFNENDRRLFTAVADHVAIAIENAITLQKSLELTNRDDLTGLYNRRYFFERLEKEVERAKRYKRLLSLLMIDIDHFKNYNDTYGHLKGDDVLRKLGTIMEASLRKADVLARYGGEEFFVMLPETDKKAARLVGEKLRQSVAKFDFHKKLPDLGPGKITITVGVSTLPADAKEALDLLERADKALYYGKAQGRNRVCTEVPGEKS